MSISTDTPRPQRVLYTAESTVTGGRAGHGRTSDGHLEVDLSIPTEMGGPGGPGTNPEQLFATGYAACFQSAMAGVARRDGLTVDDSTVTGRVGIGPLGEGRFGLVVELRIHLPSIADRAAAEDLVAQAHQRCPYSNAIRGNVDVTLSIT
ncbi:MAG TPA: organic hydroperoxide resistance protein [Chloroflexota bacterium]|jgi:Ohr subfamily peroxiredoxin|nr:organic hydroperoxide resistance protein [Chloroflexota bacterium]